MLRCGSVCVCADTDAVWIHCGVYIPQMRRVGVGYRGQVRLVTSSHPFQTSWYRRKQCILAQNHVDTAICPLTSLIIKAHTRRVPVHDNVTDYVLLSQKLVIHLRLYNILYLTENTVYQHYENQSVYAV